MLVEHKLDFHWYHWHWYIEIHLLDNIVVEEDILNNKKKIFRKKSRCFFFVLRTTIALLFITSIIAITETNRNMLMYFFLSIAYRSPSQVQNFWTHFRPRLESAQRTSFGWQTSEPKKCYKIMIIIIHVIFEKFRSKNKRCRMRLYFKYYLNKKKFFYFVHLAVGNCLPHIAKQLFLPDWPCAIYIERETNK